MTRRCTRSPPKSSGSIVKGSRLLIVLQMGGFHTIVTFLGILGKRFRDAELWDKCIESGVVTEGSVATVLEG